MKFSTLLVLTGALGVLFGALFLFAPAFGLAQYGTSSDATGLFMTRYFGTTLVYLGLLFIALSRMALTNVKGIAWAAAIGEALGCWVSVQLQLTGTINGLGWSSVVIYGLLACAFAWEAVRADTTPPFPS